MIFWCFTFTTFALFLLPFFPTAEFLAGVDVPLGRAYLFVAFCYIAFLAGYCSRQFTAVDWRRHRGIRLADSTPLLRSHQQRYPRVRNAYLGLIALWSAIGCSIAILQIQTAMGFSAYLGLLGQGGRAAEIARAATIGLEGSLGGLPGVLKMWNQNCTASAVIILNLLIAGRRFHGLISKVLLGVIAVCYITRNVLYMDRLALLVLVPTMIQFWFNGSASTRKIILGCGSLIAVLAEVQSMRRGNGMGAATYFVLYVQSGMINLSLMISSYTGPHSKGFASILAALVFVAKAFKLEVFNWDSISFDWLWNGAQDAFGSLFADFGWWTPILFAPFGYLANWLDQTPLVGFPERVWKAAARIRARSLVSYIALSMMFVPAYQGPEFWLTLATIVVASWFEFAHPDWCFRNDRRATNVRRAPLRRAFSLRLPEPVAGNVNT